MSEQSGAGPPLDGESTTDVLARVTDAVFALDGEWRFTFLNEQAGELLQRDREELIGTVVWEAFPEAVGSTFQEEYREAMETQEPTTFEEYYPPLDVWFEVRAYPSETGLSVYFRDVTERVRRNDELQRRERALRRAYEIVADAERTFDEKIDALLRVVREAVGTDYATLSHVQGDLYVFEAVDAPEDADVEAGQTVPLESTNCERVISTGRTLVLDDIERDAPELVGRSGNAEWGISCYLGAPVVVDGEVYGTFCFYDMEPRTRAFTDWQVTFVDLLSNWVSFELERQRHLDQLAVLDELNGVVRAVTDAVIDQSTREEIEAVVCERLAAADSYRFAWIGGVDHRGDRLTLRTEAGVEGYLDDVEMTDDENARTPTAEAIRTGTVQAVRDVNYEAADPAWSHQAERYGFRAWAAVPITDESTLYGVLNVYAARPDAFADQELAVVEQLGELVGHAITATQRREALMSDDVVELEFEIRDAFDSAGVSRSESGTIAFDRTVPIGEGNYHAYGWTDERGIETLRAVVDGFDSWTTLEVLSDRDEEFRFRVVLSEPPVVSVVASQGGRVMSAKIDDGDYRMRVHLPHSADVQSLVARVREAYPGARVIAQRQTPRQGESETPQYHAELLADLTQRQRAALESAFYAGFFEWPRDSNGEDVARSLDISPATFHQHLRTGERKILESLLTDEG